MTSREIRYYQQEAQDQIINELSISSKCLVKMFCGSGKSLIMKNVVSHFNLKLSVFVFPSLSLIEQFYDDYMENSKDVLKISSADDESTTDAGKIKKFLLKKITNKVICITYQSFHRLLDNLQDIKIDICCFDEAHHAVGDTYQKLIFNDDDIISKQIFFTATPKNANGIVMYDKDDVSKSMCGKLVYDYSFFRGMNEGYLNPFDIEVGLFTENTNKSIYESIARSILTTGNNRVLTFHATVNSDADSSTKNFVDEKLFNKTFNSIVNAEFESKKGFYKKVTMIGLDATVSMKDRKKILTKFKKNKDNINDNDITILCSCETIGEGVDTNDANMCVFVDPKSSVVKIIQNIGRIVRKQYGIIKSRSTILIPCWVDKRKYEECNGVKEECDKVIREDMNSDGNFGGIMNVMSALQQEQPDVYDMCLNYPDHYSHAEIEANFIKQGYKIDLVVGDGGLIETIGHMIDKEVECDDIEDISKNENVCIEVYTNLIEEQVSIYNEECDGEVVRLYKTKTGDTEKFVYQPIVKTIGGKNGGKTDKVEAINKKKICVKINANDDIKVLWNIKNWYDLQSEFRSCILNCEVINVWDTNFQGLKDFIDNNKKRPSDYSKNKDEKRIGKWLCHQKDNFKNRTFGMKCDKRYAEWNNFLEQYNEYFVCIDDMWNTNFKSLKDFIDDNKKTPSRSSKDNEEKRIGSWLSNQNKNYKNKTDGMRNNERYDVWNNFLQQYNEYIGDMWDSNFQSLKEFIDTNKKTPSKVSKNKDEKFLENWISTQKYNFKNRTQGMKCDKRYAEWNNFLEQYNKYFVCIDDVWDTNFDKLKEFIDINKKRPTAHSKDKEEKFLENWINSQNKNYKNRTFGMKCDKRYAEWNNFLEQYNEYFVCIDDVWDTNFKSLKDFIDTNKKMPSTVSKHKDEKVLSSWISTQNKNYKNRTRGMNCDKRYAEWNNFLELYNEYIDVWDTNFQSLKSFIDTNKKVPSTHSKNKDEKVLSSWIRTQKYNFKNRSFGMKCDKRYAEWNNFLEQYNEYFVCIDDVWDTNFKSLKDFIDTNKKMPSTHSKNKDEKVLSSWISTQNKNYKNRTFGMKCDKRYAEWNNFLEQYNEYFVCIDDVWNASFQSLKDFIDTNKKRPSESSKDNEEKRIGSWLSNQNRNYKNNKDGMKCDKRYAEWTHFLEQYNEYFVCIDDVWNTNFKSLKDFIDTNKKMPSSHSKNKSEKTLASWLGHQIQEHRNRTHGMKNNERYDVWTTFKNQYLTNIQSKPMKSMKLVNPKEIVANPFKDTIEGIENRRIRTKSQMEILHQRYKTLSSTNLNKIFSDDSNLWNEYHEMSEQNEESFPKEGIPRNRIIEELEKLKTKRTKTVVDMGCGRAQISKHFTDKNDTRFQFINYDHVSCNETVISCDISNTPQDNDSVEIVILSLALWGSNCKSYIEEAHRILESNGLLYIIEATKRWSDKDENNNLIQGEEGGKLKNLLIENNFQVSESKIEKFSLFVCNKRQII